MPAPRQRTRFLLSIGVATAVTASTLSACSRSYDTTQIDATKKRPQSAAPTTSIVVETIPTTTTTVIDPTIEATPVVFDIQSTLSQIVSSFAIDPKLLSQIQTLQSGDLAAIAKLFNIDLSSISQLGMTVKQIEALGQTVANAGPAILAQLIPKASPGAVPGATGAVDTGTLIGLLTGSVDVNGIVQGSVASIVQLLSDSLTKSEIKIDPQITTYLNQLLKEIDPYGLGEISANPFNASFLALTLSVVLSANPDLTKQLVENPLLDPKIKGLLSDLQALNASLGGTASAAILAALRTLFPGLGQ